MKIAFAIPFMASKYTVALEMCLLSIKKNVKKYDYDIYIQLDITNKDLYAEFNYQNIENIIENVHWRKIERQRSGDYKQSLINWVSETTEADYIIVLHSDVFFTCSNIFDQLIVPLECNHDCIASCWEVPLVRYNSTFHCNAQSKRDFYVAPRIASWLFALNKKAYFKLELKELNLFLGHFWIREKEIPDECVQMTYWLRKTMAEYFDSDCTIPCLIDIGTLFRWYVEENNIKLHIMGELDNPSFSSLEIKNRGEGFVHIEQYDPERFDNKFYSKELFERRTEIINNLLKEFAKE